MIMTMPMPGKFFIICLFVFVLFFPWPGFAQSQSKSFSSPHVPVTSRIYRDLERLTALGLITDSIYGQRPWSRDEIARQIREAMDKQERRGEPVVPSVGEIDADMAEDELLKRLKKDYASELKKLDATKIGVEVDPLKWAQLEYTLMQSPSREVRRDNGMSSIDAAIHPFTAYQGGRHFADGSTFSLETLHEASFSRYLSFAFHPRAEALIPDFGSKGANFIVQNLYGKFAYHNFEIEVGRDSVVWGQGVHGGLLLGDNARPLDQIKISNTSPILLPWLLRYFGPWKGSFFVSDMGPEREFPHSLLTGLKFSAKPVSFFEMGVSQAVLLGGDGAPAGSFWEEVGEFFGYRSGIGLTPNDLGAVAPPNFSNRIMGLDLRFTLEPLRNSQLYYEMATEACCGVFKQLYGYYGGFYIPLLTPSGSVDLRLEYTHLPPVFYRHSPFGSGWTLNRKLLGRETGPEGDSLAAEVNYDLNEKWRGQSSFAYDRLGGNSFRGGVDHTVVSEWHPKEERFRFLTALEYDLPYSLTLRLTTGMEFVKNFNFMSHDNQENFLARLGLTYRAFR